MASVDTNNGEVFFNFFFVFFLGPIIGLQVRDELQRMPPSRRAHESMVVDPVGISQSAHNAEKCEKNLLLKIVTDVTKNSTDEKLKSANRVILEGNGPHQCDRDTYRVAADLDETRNGAGMVDF